PLAGRPPAPVAQAAGIPNQPRGTGPLPSNGSQAASASTAQAPMASNSGGGDFGPPVDSEPQPLKSQPAPLNATSVAVTSEFCYQQGKARLEHKDYYGAVQLLREAVRLDSSKAPYHFHLGFALMRNPRTRREGEQHLIKAAELDPFNAQIRLRLGMIYKEAGLAKKAETYFREALHLDPENRAALKELKDAGLDKKDGGPLWKSDLGTLAKRIFKK